MGRLQSSQRSSSSASMAPKKERSFHRVTSWSSEIAHPHHVKVKGRITPPFLIWSWSDVIGQIRNHVMIRGIRWLVCLTGISRSPLTWHHSQVEGSARTTYVSRACQKHGRRISYSLHVEWRKWVLTKTRERRRRHDRLLLQSIFTSYLSDFQQNRKRAPKKKKTEKKPKTKRSSRNPKVRVNAGPLW